MDIKNVSHAVSGHVPTDSYEKLERALGLLISKGGTFRTDEKWVHAALQPLIDSGHVTRDGSTLFAGANFEQLLNIMAKGNSKYDYLLVAYRKHWAEVVSSYDVSDATLLEQLEAINTIDEKMLFLLNLLADKSAQLDIVISKVNAIEANLSEMDISLSVMESITFDEDSNR